MLQILWCLWLRKTPGMFQKHLIVMCLPFPETNSMCVIHRALRKHLTQAEMRRAARKPHLPVRVKLPVPPRPIPIPILPSSTSEPIVLED